MATKCRLNSLFIADPFIVSIARSCSEKKSGACRLPSRPPPCFHVLAEAVVIWHRKLQNSTSVSHSKLTPLLTGSPAMRTVLIKKDNKIRLDGGTRQTDRRRYGRWHTRTVQSRTHRRRSGCRSRPLSRTPPSGPDAGRRAAPVPFPPMLADGINQPSPRRAAEWKMETEKPRQGGGPTWGGEQTRAGGCRAVLAKFAEPDSRLQGRYGRHNRATR